MIFHTSYSNPFLKSPLFYYEIAVVTIHSFKFTVFFRTEVPARTYHSFQLNCQVLYLLGCSRIFIRRLVSYLITSLTNFHFFYGTVLLLFHGKVLNNPLCQGHSVYFKTPIAAIDYIKRAGFISKTFEGYCLYFCEPIAALLSKGVCFYCRASGSNILSKVLCHAANLSWWMCLFDHNKRNHLLLSLMIRNFYYRHPSGIKKLNAFFYKQLRLGWSTQSSFMIVGFSVLKVPHSPKTNLIICWRFLERLEVYWLSVKPEWEIEERNKGNDGSLENQSGNARNQGF